MHINIELSINTKKHTDKIISDLSKFIAVQNFLQKFFISTAAKGFPLLNHKISEMVKISILQSKTFFCSIAENNDNTSIVKIMFANAKINV